MPKNSRLLEKRLRDLFVSGGRTLTLRGNDPGDASLLPLVRDLAGLGRDDTAGREGSFVIRRDATLGVRRFPCRVAVDVTEGEEALTLEVGPALAHPGVEALGADARTAEILADTARAERGLVFVTGPAGAGTTTTVRAIAAEFDRAERPHFYVEEPVDDVFTAEREFALPSPDGISARARVTARLQDSSWAPTAVLVDRVRDKGFLKKLVAAAARGYLVVAAVRTPGDLDSVRFVSWLVEQGISRATVGSALAVVIAQARVPTLCPECKVPDDVTPERLHAAGLSAEEAASARLYKPGAGCASCGWSGYSPDGATLFETLRVDDEIRALIRGT